jgi:hypothetical protein
MRTTNHPFDALTLACIELVEMLTVGLSPFTCHQSPNLSLLTAALAVRRFRDPLAFT